MPRRPTLSTSETQGEPRGDQGLWTGGTLEKPVPAEEDCAASATCPSSPSGTRAWRGWPPLRRSTICQPSRLCPQRIGSRGQQCGAQLVQGPHLWTLKLELRPRLWRYSNMSEYERKGTNPPRHAQGPGTTDALLCPRSRGSDHRALPDGGTPGVRTCRPPHHSGRGLVPRCGAKDGRGVRLTPRP